MKPLAIDPATPPRVKEVIGLATRYLSDVRTMLALPQPDYGLPAGCNFAIAQVLAAVVSGISVTLYNDKGYSGERFKGLLQDFYPWSDEPENKVTPEDGAEVIYNLIRNPLTHDLGLNLANKRKGQKIIVKRLATYNKPDAGPEQRGLPESLIERLESSTRWGGVSPTVTVDVEETVVLVEAFYWGVRRMIENLSRDHSRMQYADSFLASI